MRLADDSGETSVDRDVVQDAGTAPSSSPVETKRKRRSKAANRACPSCKSGRIHRSKHQGTFERLFLMFKGMRPYRCDDCDNRFYLKRP